LHYQAKVLSSESGASISSFIKRKITSNKSVSIEKEDRSEMFESKYVKQFIETFNNVLELMDDQEKEI
jgi:predicted site-specific integrase-resolvase